MKVCLPKVLLEITLSKPQKKLWKDNVLNPNSRKLKVQGLGAVKSSELKQLIHQDIALNLVLNFLVYIVIQQY